METAEMEVIDVQMRHGTQDEVCFKTVFTDNEYRLPDQMDADDLVIDIGANVGAFAVSCLARDCGTVVCFEPDPISFKQLQKNTAHWSERIALFNAAVWRSDREAVDLRFVGFTENTACGGVFEKTEEISPVQEQSYVVNKVPSVGLDTVIWEATDGGRRRIQLLKIDAEGSEYQILYTSGCLHLVDQIVGEIHEYPKNHSYTQAMLGYEDDRACAEGIKAFLEEKCFDVELVPGEYVNQTNTLFFAKRRGA